MALAHLAPATETPLDTPAEVLAAARLHQREAEAAEVRLLEACVQWCALHPVESLAESASWASFEKFGNVGVGLAGEGAPWVCEFAAVELAAALGKSAEAGRAYLGEALELRYRLPKLWAKVTGGDLPVWRGRLVARATMPLTQKGARFVDTHVAAVAGAIGPAALERLVEEATVRFDPDEAERQRALKAEARHVTVDLRQVSFDGHVEVAATLDLADALDPLRAHQCVFPWCTRPAPERSSTDSDHVVPYSRGGLTASEIIGPLCRRHHRVKAHGGWHHSSPSLGSYRWISPSGITYTLDSTGTVDHDGHPPPQSATND